MINHDIMTFLEANFLIIDTNSSSAFFSFSSISVSLLNPYTVVHSSAGLEDGFWLSVGRQAQRDQCVWHCMTDQGSIALQGVCVWPHIRVSVCVCLLAASFLCLHLNYKSKGSWHENRKMFIC